MTRIEKALKAGRRVKAALPVVTRAQVLDERNAKRAATLRATVQRRAERAQRLLDRHLKALGREQRLVTKWRRKVAYYQNAAARAGA